jgi:hypothetical protein
MTGKNEGLPFGKPSLYHYTHLTGLPFVASIMVMDMCCLFHCAAKIKGYINNQK